MLHGYRCTNLRYNHGKFFSNTPARKLIVQCNSSIYTPVCIYITREIFSEKIDYFKPDNTGEPALHFSAIKIVTQKE